MDMNVQSQEIADDEFETFREILKEVLKIALKFPEPSINVRWLQDYSESFKKSDFTSDNLKYFFRYFPDINSVTAITLNEDSTDLVHDQLGTIINDWKFKSRRIKELIEEFEKDKNGLLPIRFDYCYEIDDPDTKAALENYIKTGELIRADKVEFEKTNLFHFEDIVLNRRTAIEKSLGRCCFAERKDEDNFESGFIAIIAPSMEGKTQSAFVLRRAKPLYFVSPGKDKEISQIIHLNYATLSRKLLDLSKEDIAKLESDKLDDNRFLVRISATNLQSEHYRKIKFRVLGFLAALIEHARNNEPALTTMSWMEFYATAPRNFDFLPKSIEDMSEFDFTGFFVFLDEFEGSRESVFVRNVCRAAGIMVVVANANSDIADMIGRTFMIHSRGPALCASCLVINHLNSLNENILKLTVPALESSIQSLKIKIKRSELPVLEGFFADFLQHQLNHLRPGFAHVIAEVIVKFNSAHQEGFSFLEFIKTLVHEFGNALVQRKPQVNSKIEGMMGTKALYFANTYCSIADYYHTPMLFDDNNYLKWHYFYLKNPTNATKWCFMAFPPIPANPNKKDAVVVVYQSGFQNPLRVMNASNQPNNWEKEATHFKAGEYLASLSLLSLWHDQSIYTIFRQSTQPEETVEITATTEQLISAVCLIDSSHRSIDSKDLTFTGQSGQTFFSNLIKNMIVADGNRVNGAITVSFHKDCEIGNLMDMIHVPFLFPANLQIPVFFQQFMSVEGFNQRSIHVGGFEKFHFYNDIDAKFQFFLKSEESDLIPSLEICAVECKYWKDSLSLDELVGIFVKAEAQNAKLSLVFCNQIADFTKERERDFISICKDSRWNVLTLFKSPTGFEFNKFDVKITLENGLYSMHCIIIELDTVNNPLGWQTNKIIKQNQ